MFERYTEKARRAIFFARHEASQYGGPCIETEFLLLGLLREDKALANRFLRSHAAIESIRKQIETHITIREKVPTAADLPLSHECKRVLAYGAEEAERLRHRHIDTPHRGVESICEFAVCQNRDGWNCFKSLCNVPAPLPRAGRRRLSIRNWRAAGSVTRDSDGDSRNWLGSWRPDSARPFP
jgi:Clp amino terminal domain, pathogenicity island component